MDDEKLISTMQTIPGKIKPAQWAQGEQGHAEEKLIIHSCRSEIKVTKRFPVKRGIQETETRQQLKPLTTVKHQTHRGNDECKKHYEAGNGYIS